MTHPMSLSGHFGADTARRWQWLALPPEFWSSHRACAGVMHFCAVGYSRPDGQTSDHCTDVEKLTWEPEFAKYVRDSFAPVGAMIDFWADEIVGSQHREIPVAVINDLETPYTGDVRLRLVQGEQTLADESRPCRVKPLGREVVSFPIDVLADTGSYRLVAEIAATGQSPVTSLRDLSVITEAQRQARAGIAVGKPVSASSSLVRAGATAPEASVDAETIRFTPTEARWVRMYGTQRATQWGYSLWELRVFP